jgi:Tfp pilus assembly protein FimT
VASTIRAARFQAVARNSNVRIRLDSPDAGQYQSEIEDPDTMTWGALGEVQYLPTGITFADDFDDIEIEPTGRAPDCAPCTIVVTNGDEEDDRTITISTSGRVRLQ